MESISTFWKAILCESYGNIVHFISKKYNKQIFTELTLPYEKQLVWKPFKIFTKVEIHTFIDPIMSYYICASDARLYMVAMYFFKDYMSASLQG